MRRLGIAVLLVAGCGSHSSSSSGPPTYWSAIKPLADAKCAPCHSEGNIAPFTLSSFADFKDHTDKVRVAVSSRAMPPWPPAKDCAEYQADRSLSDAEIKTITDWIDQGAVEGNPKDYVAGTPSSKGLTRVDRSLTLAAPYTPTLKPDEYRCFLMDWPETATKYISGFRANPGNANIVHHVIAFLAEPADVAAYQQLDDADPTPGWVCFGGPGGDNNARWLGAWAPGSLGTDYPANTGLKVQPGSKVVLQVHYNLSKVDGVADQTSVDFKLDDTVQKEAIIQPWANIDWIQKKTMTIPAGVADQMINWTFNPSPYFSFITNGIVPSSEPVTMWTASLHMHTRGTHGKLEIVHADGTRECMIDIPRWDFHWQGGYEFAQAKTYLPTDQLYLECHFDNSDSPIDRNWGEGTADEMCLGGFYVTGQ
jgi:Copper type II ascorbate-dependent monooxygenase, N-terminal domain/Copper type II ascorbate-dependent monooxygenase, C-terminal domain